ncbi:MAG: hypothetical protein OXN17_22835 [Candidatus Poribacteria bacterium]|nr:hypothetical protein [Candidatus Poribacteria bacterium]MDE0503649.1 hypothetical protein [Candidatus Poribacteria bacterium]
MTKMLQSILICLISFVLVASIGNAAGFKLVVVEEGTRNGRLTSDVNGDTIIVGAPAGFGMARIYVGRGSKWKEQAELTVKPVHGNMNRAIPSFGVAVDLTGPHELASPNYAVIGASRAGADESLAGAAFIFARNRNQWNEQAKLVAADVAPNDSFGDAVSIEGDVTVIGSPGDDDAGSGSGSAYIFVRDGTAWKQQVKLAPADLQRSDAFGTAVLVYRNTVVVGAPKHTHSGVRFTGAAYVFERNGDTWIQKAKLVADDAAKSDNFGGSLAMGGNTIIVGAPLADSDRGKDSGAAYVFVRDGAGWRQQAKFGPKDAKKADQFGSDVAVSGSIAIVGAKTREEGAPGSGAAYAFVRVNGRWEEREKNLPNDAEQKINYGESVSMSGNTVVISSHNAGNAGPESAHGVAVYVYDSVKDFDTPPYAVEASDLSATTLGHVKRTALFQNFPNPFNPETWLPYRLANDANVRIRIYDAQGRLTRDLDIGIQRSGDYLTREAAAYWDGRNLFGETVSSGVHYYTLRAGSFQATRRMSIVK